MPFDLGDVVPLSVNVTNASNVLTNVSTIVLTITLPDGTTSIPTIVNPPVATGIYVWDYATILPGRHNVRWTSTNPVSAHTDAFDVRELAPGLLFSLSDAKKTLNLTSSTHDDEVRDLIESVTASIEFIVGPVVKKTFTEKHGWGQCLVLRNSPVISVTSIVPIYTNGVSYLPADCDIDTDTGVVVLKDGRIFSNDVRVTLTAGRPITPAGIRDASRIILKHLWAIQSGSAGLPSFRDEEEYRKENTTMIPGLGFALPNRAIELLQPFALGPKVG